MDRTAATLALLRRFAQPVTPNLPASDEALPAVRALLVAAGVAYKIVGGLAVVHHGYLRFTRDVDVLVGRDGLLKIEPYLARFAFEKKEPKRLVHTPTGVQVDFLVEGDLVPRAASARFPAPDLISASVADPGFVGLGPLTELKILSGRVQDRADVVALLKLVDEGGYLAIEAGLPATLRPALAALREEALEELRFGDE
ncbi:MAG: hypothetical protein IPG45_33090 [Deltaproteobacteria bacterium]|nr:hypothetical protein [Deltaproteobacteria bacterium]